MIGKLLFGNRGIGLMKGGLDAGTARMRAIGENVANAATPGYRAQEVKFEELIEKARESLPLRRTNGAHIAGTSPVPRSETTWVEEPVPEGAVNNVDVEQQLVDMQQNQIHYQALSQFLANRYKGIRDAIR